MIEADLERSNMLLSTFFTNLVIYTLAPKVYFGYISLIIAASHMIHVERTRGGFIAIS